ncbi:hypothetical protein NE237_011666 [Protea cynaroides]|uniref:Uncharacterized protein n=1 Tax=Protea cynaroides TaxID=273540 RepID=A0A9Q0GW27_9MAGN|nr:hypothetical protein NE237_011666 [Protea cynaroides]
MNLTDIGADDHHNEGLELLLVATNGNNVAEGSSDPALKKNFGLLKQIFKETISLHSGGVGGDIPVATGSTGFKETATKGVSPLKVAACFHWWANVECNQAFGSR